MAKKEFQPPPEFGLIDATEPYTKELRLRLSQLYPPLTADHQEALGSYKILGRGGIRFISFRPLSETQKFIKLVLTTALQKGSEHRDPVLISSHGEEHQTYHEVLSTVREAVLRTIALIHMEETNSFYDSNRRLVYAPIRRLVVETPQFDRQTTRPAPLIESFKIPDEQSAQITEIRRIAKDKQSLPIAILAAIYKGVSINTLFTALGNKDFITSLPFRPAKYLTVNRREDKIMLHELYHWLWVSDDNDKPIFISRSPDSYFGALQTLQNYRWITQVDRSHPNFGFIPFQERVFGRVVFVGMVEVAQEIASRDFYGEYRHRYILDTYGPWSTTRILTAYFPGEH